MKILVSSYCFSPSIGGIETVSSLLACEFVRLGHLVKVITETHENDSREWPFSVHRHPTARDLLSLTRWSDVFFHNNISLRSAWPLLVIRRPWVIAHQTWISRLDRSLAPQDHLKRFLLRFATNVAIGGAIARDLPISSVLIGNPYDDEVFRRIEAGLRDTELIYLGRLVSDKGVDTLIRAVALLKGDGLVPALTIAGSGSEEQTLRALAAELNVSGQITFVGAKRGEELAELLNRHNIMVVPSRWAEPFGIVALEGIACGCVVIGSEGGGLPEPIGPCGLTFPNGDVSALAGAIRRLLTDDCLVDQLRNAAPEHLAKYTASHVAAAYLKVFKSAIA